MGGKRIMRTLKDLLFTGISEPKIEWKQGIPKGGNDGDVLTKVKTEGAILLLK